MYNFEYADVAKLWEHFRLYEEECTALIAGFAKAPDKARYPVLGAYDLVDLLGSHGRRMAPITIYRALDFLIAQGLVHRLASLNAYIVSSDTSGGHEATAFLICEGCGDVNEVTSPDVAEIVLKVLREQGYQPRTKILEITGRCRRCEEIH